MKILHLTVKKKFFEMLYSGEKKEEYRAIKTYWINRFFEPKIHQKYIYDLIWILQGKNNELEPNAFIKNNHLDYKEFDVVCFRHGYSKNPPTILIEFIGIEIGTAKPELSDNWQGNVFKIKLGEFV